MTLGDSENPFVQSQSCITMSVHSGCHRTKSALRGATYLGSRVSRSELKLGYCPLPNLVFYSLHSGLTQTSVDTSGMSGAIPTVQKHRLQVDFESQMSQMQ